MSVDLPDPEGPMMATNSPRSTVTLTPSSAFSVVSPRTYVLRRSVATTSGEGGVEALTMTSRPVASAFEEGRLRHHDVSRLQVSAGDLHDRPVPDGDVDHAGRGHGAVEHPDHPLVGVRAEARYGRTAGHRGRRGGVGLEAEGRVRRAHDAVSMRIDERGVGGHRRPQRHVAVVDVDDRVVGD